MVGQQALTHNRGFSINVSKVSIKKMSTGEELHIVDDGSEAGGMGTLLISMTMEESIMKKAIVGNLVVKNPGKMIETFNITGTDEIVHIEMKTPHLEGSEQVLEFCIVSVNEFGKGADSTHKYGGPIKSSKSQLHFMSCEPMYLDIADWRGDGGDFLNQDMFLKIATGTKGGIAGTVEEVLEWLGLDEEDGLVDAIAPKYFNGGNGWAVPNPMDIEGTDNTIWLRTNSQLYPWGKETNSMTLMQLMSNLAENAIVDDTWCNFMFYPDFDGWHFKSIKKMIEDNTNGVPKAEEAGEISTEDPYVYSFKDGISSEAEADSGDPKILSSVSVTSPNHLILWKKGVYASYYYHIQPDYSDPYHYYMDTATVHKNKFIDYQYHREWDEKNWKGFTVETYKFLPEPGEEGEGGVPTEIDPEKPNKNLKFRNIPEVYGYFSNAYNSENPYNKFDFLSSRTGDGSLGKRNDVVWQTMSDQTNLELSKIKTIQQDIIGPTKENYLQYVFLKNLKEKWNIYRYSICCDKFDDKRQFLAVIDDAILLDEETDTRGGIYEYSWREVEMWPTSDVEDVGGGEILTKADSPITIVVVPESKGGLRGIAGSEETNMRGAFNLNELMNMQEGDDVFVGPGVNVANGEDQWPDGNDYPEAHQMMPVGGYFTLGENAIEPCQTREDSEATVYFHKHIVEMNALPEEMLETISHPGEDIADPRPLWNSPERIYFFDVQNAHDGLCSCGKI